MANVDPLTFTEHTTTVYGYTVNGVRYADVVEVDNSTGIENSVVFTPEIWPAMRALIEEALRAPNKTKTTLHEIIV